MSTNHVLSRLALLAASGLVSWLGATQPEGAYMAPQATSLGTLRAASATPVTIEYQGGFPVSVRMDVATSGTSPAERARTFLMAYADLYLQNDPDVKLIHVRTDRDAAAGDLVRFGQSFHGLPVFGAEIVVHLGPAAAGAPGRVLRTSGALLVPARTDRIPAMKIDLDRVPGVTAQMAADAARSHLGRAGAPLRGETIIVIYDPAVFGATVPDDVKHLAWRVTLGGGEPIQILIDANTSEVLFQQPLVSAGSGLDDFDLNLDDGNGNEAFSNSCFDYSYLDDDIGTEDGIDPAYFNDVDAVAAWWYARDTYLTYHDVFGRHSFDDDDANLNVWVHAGLIPTANGPAIPNAASNIGCNGIEFSDGWVSKDVMAHEFTHLVTRESSNLMSQGEPGALNEAFSDIMGAIVDPDDWLHAEDRTGGMGANRDLADPTQMSCPDRNPCPDRYSQFVITGNDSGGIHTNMTIITKAFYLMSDGGTFNGRTVPAMGRTRAGGLAYRVFTGLPSNAGFTKLRNDMVGWAEFYRQSNLHGFTMQTVCSVRQAFRATEIGQGDVDCDGVEDNVDDNDLDGILDDGDSSGSETDNPCPSGVASGCDDNCKSFPNPGQADWDGDGVGDACDGDDDNDGWPDAQDACPTDPFEPGDFPGDSDGDSIPNCGDPDDDNDGVPDDGDNSGSSLDSPCPSNATVNCDDNCQLHPNPTQFDGNQNGYGDACDPDFDGDGHYSGLNEPNPDNCPWDFNPNQEDADADGLGDVCDLCPGVYDNLNAWSPGNDILGTDPEPFQPDTDGDGLPDACDPLPFFDAGVLMGGRNYSRANPMRPDGSPRQFQMSGPSRGGSEARLYFPACETGDAEGPGPEERVEIVFLGLPETVNGWVEDGTGQVRARIRVSNLDPERRGLRFRPRCDETYFIHLRTEPGFAGLAEFSGSAAAMVPSGENPWTTGPPGLGEPPAPLPDQDRDGLLDPYDTCPLAFDPTGADADADGAGDVCDTCPNVPNPDQGPLEFPEVVALDADTLSWGTHVTFDFVKGPLSGIATYEITESGTRLAGDSFPMSGDRDSTYYLFRLSECGTWGSPQRDAALP